MLEKLKPMRWYNGEENPLLATKHPDSGGHPNLWITLVIVGALATVTAVAIFMGTR